VSTLASVETHRAATLVRKRIGVRDIDVLPLRPFRRSMTIGSALDRRILSGSRSPIVMQALPPSALSCHAADRACCVGRAKVVCEEISPGSSDHEQIGRQDPAFARAIIEFGPTPVNLDHVVLTHSHNDHIGSGSPSRRLGRGHGPPPGGTDHRRSQAPPCAAIRANRDPAPQINPSVTHSPPLYFTSGALPHLPHHECAERTRDGPTHPKHRHPENGLRLTCQHALGKEKTTSNTNNPTPNTRLSAQFRHQSVLISTHYLK
jgi:hypothetical protein